MKGNIEELQLSALSRINFCFYELKNYPPMDWINDVINKNSVENTKENYLKMNKSQRSMFSKELFNYLDMESTTEARIMLIINYLAALLIRGKNNHISIYKNFIDKIKEIEDFKIKNSDLIGRIKTARDKLYAHIDLDWMSCLKTITFEEFERCINFLNNLFDYDFKKIKELGL